MTQTIELLVSKNVVGWLFELCQKIAQTLPGCEVIEPEWSEV